MKQRKQEAERVAIEGFGVLAAGRFDQLDQRLDGLANELRRVR